MSFFRSVFAVLVGLSIASAIPSVAEAATPKEKQEAKQLVSDAKKAIKGGSFDDAVAKLRRADELDPSAATKVELANALAQSKKLIEATQVLRAAIEQGTGGAWAEKKAAEAAQSALKELEPRIPWLAVSVEGPPESAVKVKVDGNDAEPGMEAPVDPGEHTVSAEAEGYERAEKQVKVAEGKHEAVKLTLTKIETTPAPAAASDDGGDILPAAIAFGVGGAGVVVGSIFGIMAISQTGSVKDQCNDSGACPKDQASDLDSAKTSGTISTIGFIVGGVGIATGVVLLVLGGDAPANASLQAEAGPVTVTPFVGVDQAGVVGRF